MSGLCTVIFHMPLFLGMCLIRRCVLNSKIFPCATPMSSQNRTHNFHSFILRIATASIRRHFVPFTFILEHIFVCYCHNFGIYEANFLVLAPFTEALAEQTCCSWFQCKQTLTPHISDLTALVICQKVQFNIWFKQWLIAFAELGLIRQVFIGIYLFLADLNRSVKIRQVVLLGY